MDTPLIELLKEMTPNMTPQLRWKYKKNLTDDTKNQNNQLIEDLLYEIIALREHNKSQKLTISRLKNEIYSLTRYGKSSRNL